MLAKRLTPILNVSDIQRSFAWFEKLGWQKGWDWGPNCCGRKSIGTGSPSDSLSGIGAC
jgi:hypothetical protein